MSEINVNGCKTALSQPALEKIGIAIETKTQSSEKSKENDDVNSIYSDKIYYENAKKYWATIKPDVDGMLGGLSCVNFVDIQFSKQFLTQVFKTKPSPGRTYACDCGAGIGRITKNLLLQFFDTIDLVEQDTQFCEKARTSLEKSGHLGKVYNQGLQDFEPERERYDVVWIQWVLGHLKNDHFIYFFRRVIQSLRKNGMIIVKENMTSADKVEFDDKDFSVTRPLSEFKGLLAEAGLRIVREIRQNNFPKGLYPVYMFALRPI